MLTSDSSEGLVYKMNNASVSDILLQIGFLLRNMVFLYKDSDICDYSMLSSLYSEQYTFEEGDDNIILKPSKDISSDSIQSPHDLDCSYRKKGDKKLSGYSVNLTETVSDSGLDLILDVGLERASFSDTDFLAASVCNVDNLLEEDNKIKEVYTDGAYHSEDNDSFCETNKIKHIHTGMQGSRGHYEFLWSDDGILFVKNLHSGLSYIGEEYLSSNGELKYKIKEDSKYHYFSNKQIDCYFKRLEIEHLPNEVRNRRNNVEASIFQLAYFCRKDKVKYRGILRVKLWAIARCMWINLVRIKNYMGELRPIGANLSKFNVRSVNILQNFCFFSKFFVFGLNFCKMIRY